MVFPNAFIEFAVVQAASLVYYSWLYKTWLKQYFIHFKTESNCPEVVDCTRFEKEDMLIHIGNL